MCSEMEKLYQYKEAVYYSHVREDIISLVKGEDLTILEVGCGSGATLLELKRLGKAKEVTGIELNSTSLEKTGNLLDRVVIGNIESIQLDFKSEYFDVIIFADVLEHLVNPWETLENMKNYLKPRGSVIASIPNIREYSVLKSIIKGDFKYVDAGILDKTHLRFFCKKNIFEMFAKDYEITDIKKNMDIGARTRRWFNRLTFGMFDDFFTVQYLVVARKNASGWPKMIKTRIA